MGRSNKVTFQDSWRNAIEIDEEDLHADEPETRREETRHAVDAEDYHRDGGEYDEGDVEEGDEAEEDEHHNRAGDDRREFHDSLQNTNAAHAAKGNAFKAIAELLAKNKPPIAPQRISAPASVSQSKPSPPSLKSIAASIRQSKPPSQPHRRPVAPHADEMYHTDDADADADDDDTHQRAASGNVAEFDSDGGRYDEMHAPATGWMDRSTQPHDDDASVDGGGGHDWDLNDSQPEEEEVKRTSNMDARGNALKAIAELLAKNRPPKAAGSAPEIDAHAGSRLKSIAASIRDSRPPQSTFDQIEAEVDDVDGFCGTLQPQLNQDEGRNSANRSGVVSPGSSGGGTDQWLAAESEALDESMRRIRNKLMTRRAELQKRLRSLLLRASPAAATSLLQKGTTSAAATTIHKTVCEPYIQLGVLIFRVCETVWVKEHQRRMMAQRDYFFGATVAGGKRESVSDGGATRSVTGLVQRRGNVDVDAVLRSVDAFDAIVGRKDPPRGVTVQPQTPGTGTPEWDSEDELEALVALKHAERKRYQPTATSSLLHW